MDRPQAASGSDCKLTLAVGQRHSAPVDRRSRGAYKRLRAIMSERGALDPHPNAALTLEAIMAR